MVVMDFSGVYLKQTFWKKAEADTDDPRQVKAREEEGEPVVLDLQGLHGTSCYCDEEARKDLLSRIALLPIQDIHFLDSGNYHYLTRLWAGQIQNAFQLVVFDHHTDMQPPAFGGLLSCGGWLDSLILEVPLLQSVLLVGPPKDDFEAAGEEARAKTALLSEEALSEVFPDPDIYCTGLSSQADTGLADVPSALRPDIFFREHLLPRVPVYLSVDKDILSEKVLKTNWSQGCTDRDTFFRMLSTLFQQMENAGCVLLGADICGEDSPDHPESFPAHDRINRELWEEIRRYL